MQRIAALFLLGYFGLGSMILPLGDFRTLADIPKMYVHCQTVEDTDMNAWDFVKDHLLNWDSLFDKHDNGDKQKPHTPIPFTSVPQHLTCILFIPQYSIHAHTHIIAAMPAHYVKAYTFNPMHNILRPPQCCI